MPMKPRSVDQLVKEGLVALHKNKATHIWWEDESRNGWRNENDHVEKWSL